MQVTTVDGTEWAEKGRGKRERPREDGTVPPIEEDIIMGRRESEVAKDERGKKESL